MRKLVLLLAIAACGDDGVRHTHDASHDAPGTPNPGAGIYVSVAAGAIEVFALGATGDTAPVRQIAGAATMLSLPIGFDVDGDGNLFVTNRTGARVTMYPHTADGNVAPTRTLTATGMASPAALVVGAGNDIYVSTCPSCGQSSGGDTGVFHFAKGADTSDREIGGATNAATMLTNPGTMAIDRARGELIVGNAFGGVVEAFAPTAQGDVAPARSFSPGSGNLQFVTYADDTIFVAMPNVGIEMFPRDATGTPTPTTIPFDAMLPVSFPGSISIDTSVSPPDLYVVDYSGNALYIAHTAGTLPNLSVASVDVLKGASTQLSSPLVVQIIR
jgi:hypothetical protein